MKSCFCMFGLFVCLLNAANAANLVETFEQGIPLERWSIVHNDAGNAPWNVVAPDAGGMRVSKPIDQDASTAYVSRLAGIDSRFTLEGNFSVFVDFTLIDFPYVGTGWNEAVLVAYMPNGFFEILRFRGSGLYDHVEAYASSFANIGLRSDSTTIGKFGVTRQGTTMTAWLDRGTGPVPIGYISKSTAADRWYASADDA